MNDNRQPHRPKRQLSGLAASGGMLFYLILAIGLAVVVAGLIATRFFQLTGS